MIVATTIPRYNKNQLLIIDNKEIRLIDYLSELRINKKITKKQISNLVKHNDYWYSQIERDGKKGDDNRQRTIYRTDLIKIIAILQYGALTSKDLSDFQEKSEIYLDKVIKAVPLQESLKELNLYELSKTRTDDEQKRLLDSLLTTHENILRNTFTSLTGNKNRDNFLDALKNINLSMKIDPLFVIFLMGLPFADFLYEANQDKINSLFREIIHIMDSFTIEQNSSVKTSPEYLDQIRKKIIEYTGTKFEDSQNKPYSLLPPEQWKF